MTKSFQQITAMHALFCRLINRPIPFDMTYLYPWERWLERFTEDDTRLLVTYLKSLHAKRRPARALTLRSLITGPMSIPYAEEDLAMARAEFRKPAPTPRQQILRAAGRPEPEPDQTKSAAKIIEHMKLAKMLSEYRQTL